jgi:hypothetical protein
VGLVRGAALFELNAFEITAQAGSMVGVEKEERIATPIKQSFKFRNPVAASSTSSPRSRPAAWSRSSRARSTS